MLRVRALILIFALSFAPCLLHAHERTADARLLCSAHCFQFVRIFRDLSSSPANSPIVPSIMLRLTTVTHAASPQTKSTLDRDPMHTFLTCTSYLRSTVWNIGISTPLSVRTRNSLLTPSSKKCIGQTSPGIRRLRYLPGLPRHAPQTVLYPL